jgi:uncharacterized cupin superfamily protein
VATMSNPLTPFAVLSREGTPLEIPFGRSVTIKAHTRNPPKAGSALHIHLREDESWYVFDSEYRFKADDAVFRLSKGGMAFGPRARRTAFRASATRQVACW